MQPQPWPEVPADTVRVAKKAFRKGTLAIRARDELGSWYDDAEFAAYGARGKPGISPTQLAMVTVLQFTGNLTDRQAVDAVRGRLDWKYCLGLALDEEGFDFSVLSEFRARLVAGSLELKILDMLLDRLKGRCCFNRSRDHPAGRLLVCIRSVGAGQAARPSPAAVRRPQTERRPENLQRHDHVAA